MRCLFIYFLDFLDSEKRGCQQRDAMNWIGCTGDVDRTSKAGHYLRLCNSAWKNNFIFNSLSYWKPVQFNQEW